MEDLQLLHKCSDDVRAQIMGEMPACDARGPLADSLGQPDQIDLNGPRRRRQLVLLSNSDDEAQDRVPLAERIRQVPPVLHHSPALQSVPTIGIGASAAAVDIEAASEAPPTSSLPWDAGLWGVNLDELL
jgi:hypothetical protein